MSKMAYVVPIHRASSIRDALKLRFLNAEEETLVVALVALSFFLLWSSSW